MLFGVIRNVISGQHVDLWAAAAQVLSIFFVIFCILPLHEFAHGWVANKLGDPTAKLEGRLTMNPLASVEPMGALALLLFGFGWAKPVPVDPRYFKKPKRGMALTALAGPVSNFLLAVLALLPAGALLNGTLGYGDGAIRLVYFLMDVSLLSIGLGIFNLLPIPPLDGSKVLFSILPDRVYAKLLRYERYGFFVLLAIMYFDIGSKFLSEAINAVFLFLWRVCVGIPIG